MKKKLIALPLLFSSLCMADPATYTDSWQYNSNVKIDFIYTYWNSVGFSHVKLDNGEFCYIKDNDKSLLSAALAMRAQQATGQVVCSLNPDKTVDGHGSRYMHRLKY